MIILTNCLQETVDEGCLKVAGSLIKRLKKENPETTIITYDRKTEISDVHLSVNKFMLSRKLGKLLRRSKEPVLYVPFSSKMKSMAIRLLVLSLSCRGRLSVIRSIQSPMDGLSKALIKISGAKMIALSHAAWEYYRGQLGERVSYLKAGVDTSRFLPASKQEKAQLKEKYGIPKDKIVVLHVGHLNSGRNVQQLLKLDDRFHALLVVSTLTADAREESLREQFLLKENATLIEDYIPDIQEIYQLSDVYLFPVMERGRCIDVPLSAMEAAACNVPVVATPFGELKELMGLNGFYEIESFEKDALQERLITAVTEEKQPRANVLAYDWNTSVKRLTEMLGGGKHAQ
jgi:glycosyltransferase involved in cell wall biosynthesis